MAVRKLQLLPDYDPTSAASKMATMGVAGPNRDTIMAATKPRQGLMVTPDSRDARSIPSIMTPGAVSPKTIPSGNVIDERGGTGTPSGPSITYSPSMGTMNAIPGRVEGTPQASVQRQLSPTRPSSEVAAVRDYSPTPVQGVPGFVNYYEQMTQPFDDNYRRAVESSIINQSEAQAAATKERIGRELGQAGIMRRRGVGGLETALMARAAQQAEATKSAALNQLAMDLPQKQAEFNMRRAEGMMRAQDEQFRRFVDEQLLPMKIAENKEQVKQIMLQNGVNQYAIDQYMKMDVNEWPDWVKNAVKLGVMGYGLYTGQPQVVAAGAAFR